MARFFNLLFSQLFFVLYISSSLSDCCYAESFSTDAKVSQKKNVLFIAVNDLRPELGCYGSQIVRSPKLEFQQQLIAATSVSVSADDDPAETSFEDSKAGAFTKLKSNVGDWEVTAGSAVIDNKHANTGRQCLHLTGGGKTEVVLKLASGIKPDGKLEFAAERWTSRAPFEFRIEKKSNGQWTEVFNGDKRVIVGRPFRSNISVPLSDPKISHLRFRVTSPENTGVLIDDLRIAPLQPQKITSVDVVPLQLPALVGAESSAIVKLKIVTQGSLDPIAITRIAASLVGQSAESNVKTFQPFYGGSESNFRWNIPIGKPQTPKRESQKFVSKQQLVEGDNYIWLACKLNDDADIDQTIAGTIDSISFSNGDTKTIDAASSIQRLGVAVRKAGDDGVHTYRIPGLATSNKGTLIGVYDVRYDGGGDLPGNIDVGMSRSTDGGQSWEPMQVIMDMGSDPKWRGDGIGDPAVLVDRKTGTIWVSATWSHGNRSWNGSGPGLNPEETGQWMLAKSDDDGLTWSKPINITTQVKKPEWAFLLQGPGKGITLSDGTIVFPAQYQDPPNNSDKKANRLPHATFIYSRDHGDTWSIGRGAWDDTTEAQVVELADGELMINCRNNRAAKRAIMTTRDMGASWQQHPTHVRDLIEPGSCMASLINVGRELGWRDLKGKYADNEFLLFSNPDSLRGRNHITIKASLDSGKSWPAQQSLLLDEQGGRGYSCMSMIDSETVGILYEGSQSDMTFQRVNLADILNPPANQKTKNPALASVAGAMRIASTPRPEKTNGDLKFARPFGDHMVLQSDQPIRIWGTAKPNQKIQVGLPDSKVSKSTLADKKGIWRVDLPAQNVNRKPQRLVAISNEKTISLNDVLIGEVWFCAGQSNMEWELRKSIDGQEAVAHSSDPLLRLHNCPGGARGSSGAYTEKHMQSLWPQLFSSGQWHIASPSTTASFSAVGYFFAKRIREELDVPVGMINVSVGGTPIESWVSADRLKADQELSRMFNGNWLENSVLDQWCRQRARDNLNHGLNGDLEVPGDEFGPNHSFKPGFMYEAGIKPFAPLSIRGVLWYQGESNGDNAKRIKIYDNCFPLLVEDWRSGFQNRNMPIVFVQLPAMGRPNWPQFREYQRRSLKHLTNVGMAITIDTGHQTDVHPADKRPIGNRLAQWALVKSYGKSGLPMGPIYNSKIIDGDTVEISFDHAGSLLKTRDGEPPRHFEMAGSDNIFYPADAVIKNDKVELRARNIRQPVFVRYAWSPFPNPFPNLVNEKDLPASPFTTQDVIPDG